MTVIGTIFRDPGHRPEIYVICPGCNDERWAPYRKYGAQRVSRLCSHCNLTQNKRGFNLQTDELT